MLKAKEITDIINEIHQGVENSKCGKLDSGLRDPNGNVVFNGLSFNTYFKIIEATFKEQGKS